MARTSPKTSAISGGGSTLEGLIEACSALEGFEELKPANARKLFVGMTRGQVRVEVVLSERAAKLLAAALRPNS